MNSNRNKEKGFTLVELLFVVILLSILGVSVMKVIFYLEATSRTAQIARQSSETLSSLSISIRSLLLSRGNSNLQASSNSTAQNITGIQRSIIVEKGTGNTSDTLRFASIIPASFEPNLGSLVGEREVKLYVDTTNDEKPLVVEIWPVLGKAETPLYRAQILEHVEEFKVRQWQGKAWTDSWDNPYSGAPRLLEITIIYLEDLNSPKTTVRFTSPLGANS